MRSRCCQVTGDSRWPSLGQREATVVRSDLLGGKPTHTTLVGDNERVRISKAKAMVLWCLADGVPRWRPPR